MRMTRKGNLYQLTFMPRFFPVNCYIVDEGSELTLIDAALPFSAEPILKAANELGKPITRIVLTHAHEDHVGALDKLKAALPSAKVYISARDSLLLAGDRSLLEGEPNTPIKGGVPKKLTTRADVLLSEGDMIGSLRAVMSPGHTPGSMSLLDTRSGALIIGDAMQTRGGVAVSGQFKPWFPFPAFATWHKEIALASVRKLYDLKPTLLAVGHGVMLENPAAAMNKAIAEAESKLGQQRR
ncbi:glyoxylase-like metal-dependent hydrolase (beta-lactamase superfamily II) [Paenibacillus taihuensis]|uniref:Glyoxylase-like metal-dependent hydrolase (Beta-lactamase superfamily II) n=1 Tax=Paenibacillus taihuensis TaxID=1156355 RepID=A0A3D9QUW8_9BACL|nr:MBL fold metallo-hydrolase [Paenibacillus taihuensis]REE67646.1 glyoxylase-like metal-dependent hydrolase (beta-lactamase superfamily II) [Paenibacillus taihuensis]